MLLQTRAGCEFFARQTIRKRFYPRTLMQSKCDPGVRADLFLASHCVLLSVCSVRFCGRPRHGYTFFFAVSRGAKAAVVFRRRTRGAGELARELAWSSTEDLVNESVEGSCLRFPQRNRPRSLPVCLAGKQVRERSRSRPDRRDRSCFLPIFPFLSIFICAATKPVRWLHSGENARAYDYAQSYRRYTIDSPMWDVSFFI